MKILALIPARGGSKGIPGKNIVPLGGKPLLQYTLEIAFKVERIGRTLVSTDDEEIAAVARNLGCDIPFLRPADLAGDTARTVDAVLYALDELHTRFGEDYDAVLLLQPTSPFRTVEDVDNAIDLFLEKPNGSVVSVELVDEPHPRKMKVLVDGSLQPYVPGSDSSVPRQDLPAVYSLNGAIYLSSVVALRSTKSFFGEPSRPYVMPWERSVNINGERDLLLARALLASAQ